MISSISICEYVCCLDEQDLESIEVEEHELGWWVRLTGSEGTTLLDLTGEGFHQLLRILNAAETADIENETA